MRITALLGITAIALSGAASAAEDDSGKNPPEPSSYGCTSNITSKAGNLLFLSGAMGEGRTLEEQIRFSYKCIQSTLKPFNATLADVVNETFYTTDVPGLKKSAVDIWTEFFGKVPHASTVIGVTRLWGDHAQVEIQVVVALK